ncbi:PhoX family protein [Marinobacterium rhizophilum]|uniref:PhoX family protein n=1 Tax=Marinobacterium rhizophilum TaxID=420402 RepID=UPI000365F438|nr:PhoX family phosphatase [Marinobacterium rhizophilum]
MKSIQSDVNAQDTDALDRTGFDALVDKALSRRSLLKGGMAAGMLGFFSLSPVAQAVAAALEPSRLLGFKAIKASTDDAIALPAGYRSSILMSWGDPVLPGAPEFDHKGGNSAADQALQFGDNTDGMALFHFRRPDGSNDPDRAVLAVNNEYCNYKYLLQNGEALTREDVDKAKAAHGNTVVELVREGGQWRYVRDSKLNRRIHLETEMQLTGPVAGHALVQTAADPDGRKVFGTVNNCANGRTPWGTYLTCEENFQGVFGADRDEDVPPEQARYGIKAAEDRYRWWQHDDRFNLSKTPNEPNRFGWIVEYDPFDPQSTPMKRTALGRVKHENAELVLNKDGHVVVYMGDDERGEHIYRFVSKNKFVEGQDAMNRTLLEDGTLYVAQFNGDSDKHAGRGRWIELSHGKNGLSVENGFADQADVLVHTRRAAKQVEATTMDRPEWVTHNPHNGQVYCTLTNNKHRGNKDEQPLNAANPRASNHYGQIIRWEAKGGDHTAETFDWDLYLIAGNPTVHEGNLYAGSDAITADNMFNSPDGLGFDNDGRLWIQTDGDDSNAGDFAGMGNNQMLCGDPATGEIRRFMVGPVGAEVTGLTFSDDCKTMFVGIQHPTGAFPDYLDGGKPRSSIVVVTREDGGVIGAA